MDQRVWLGSANEMKGVSADSELESLSYLIIHVPQVCNATFLNPDHYNRQNLYK